MKRRSAVVALLAAALLPACSGSPAGKAPNSGQFPIGNPATGGTTASGSTTQWWTATDYCGILRDTVHAGHSILPGATARDPRLLSATKAFVASVTAAAPSAIRPQWQVLGPAVVALVESGGKPAAMSGVNTRLVAQAATQIAADTKTRCSLNLSS